MSRIPPSVHVTNADTTVVERGTYEVARDVRTGGTFQSLKVRDFALLWSGQTVSSLGDGIFTIALANVTLDVDHHPSGFAVVFAALANFFGMAPLSVLLPFFVRETLHASALDLRLVFAAGGATGIVASLVVARFGPPRRQVTVLWLSYAASGAAIAVMAFAPNVLVTALLTAVEVGFMLYGDVLWFAMMRRLVPHEVLGRVSCHSFFSSRSPSGLSASSLVASPRRRSGFVTPSFGAGLFRDSSV